MLARGLAAHGHDVRVLLLVGGGHFTAELERSGIHVADAGLRRSDRTNLLAGSRAVVAMAAKLRGRDIVQSYLFQANVLAACAARLAGAGVIIVGRRSPFTKRPVPYQIANRLANRLADVIVANAEALRHDTIDHEHVPASKLRVIGNGLDIAEFDRRAREPNDVVAPDQRGPVVAVVANFHRYKGHTHFLRAWQKVVAEFPTATALLVGSGDLEDELRHARDALELTSSVRFLGQRTNVPSLLGRVDLLVHPSLEEGMANVLLEAMAARRPVVATTAGGSAEVVVNGVTGILVAPQDEAGMTSAILKVLSEPQTAQAMGEAGRARVAASFSSDAMVDAHERLYAELLAGRRQDDSRSRLR